MNYLPLVQRTWNLADVMMGAAGRPLHVTVLVADEQKNVLAIKSDWAGGEKVTSRAPYFGPKKAAELVDTIQLNSKIIAMTPVPTFKTSTGFMGGVRRMYDGKYLITACSAWDEKADALMALVLNYAMTYELRFHHVGFTHLTEEAMWTAISKDQSRLGVMPLPIDSDDSGYILRVEEQRVPNGVYWIEHHYSPVVLEPTIFWGVVTTPGLVEYLGFWMDLQPGFNVELSDNDRLAMIQVTDRDGTELAIMERSKWWDVDVQNAKRGNPRH